MNCDIVLLSTPVMETRFPAPAIYYLKGALKPYGFTARCYDLVRDQEDHFGNESKKFNSFLLADWHSGMHHNESDKEIYNELYSYYKEYIVKKVIPHNPRFVGLSVFSQNSQKATEILCTVIREVMPDVKIVVGGTGLGNSIAGQRGFGDQIRDNGLVDYTINGEGEIALVELLKGDEKYTGINTPYYKQIDDLDSIAFPDYDDYLEDYGNIESITLTGSRGCVRACSFCDIGAFWKKYRYRSGKNIAEEMIRNKKRYGSRLNFFSDSLINGSMKAFREMCEVLAEYHKNNPGAENRIIWGGQFIIRSERQSPAADYELMWKAGMRWASIGIESASENVRNHMEKGYSNEDMYFAIDQLVEKGMQVTLMFIVGYPTETLEDFEENIKFLKYYADRNSSAVDVKTQGCVRDINLGQTLGILEGAPLAEMDVYEGSSDLWVSTVVPGLDYGERFRRRKLMGEVALELGYDVRWNEKQMHFLEKKLDHWKLKEHEFAMQLIEEEKDDITKSETFCVLPWMHLATSASGNLRVCCNSTPGKNFIRKKDGGIYKIYNDNLEEAWNSETYKTIRHQLANNERPEMCQRCFREEDAGIKSARQNWNNKWLPKLDNLKIDADFNIKYVDIRLGNLCNLRCRMCNPYASNLWVDEHHLVDNALSPDEFDRLKNMDWPENKKTWKNLFSIAHTVDEIYLTGGEPTIIKEQHKLLDYYIDNGTAKNIKLKYNTNLTNVPQHLIDRWKEFKRVQLNCSIDAVGDLNRYIRYPSNWDKIVENFEKIQNLENVYIEVHCTVQMYNILELDKFIDWAEPYRHKIYFNILNHPEELNIRVLPKELKEVAAARLLPYMHLDKVKGIIDYMNAEDWNNKLEKFFDYTNALDKSRNQRLELLLPELWRFYEKR